MVFKLCIIKLKHGEISVEAAQRQVSRWNQFDSGISPQKFKIEHWSNGHDATLSR
jgi:hypothetical protein